MRTWKHWNIFDFSAVGWNRVVVFTIVGSLCCVALALAIDSYSFEDVDHFKLVNDSFGHDAGDEALKLIVQSVKSTLRDVDLVGRMGGEEFSVFLPGVMPEAVNTIADRMRDRVRTVNFCPQGLRHNLSISVGVATFVGKTTFSELYRLADRRLYDAKRNGRDRIEISQLMAGADMAA